MSRTLRVHFLPNCIEPAELRGSVAVMIDVLRASTTIVHALSAGATAVVPFADVESARRFAANPEADPVVLGGERDGVRIEGFDLDNSPLRYVPETVGGKTVAFTTTNGTRALERCRKADRVLIGAFVNRGAIVRELLSETRPVHLVCAGTRGRVTAEDVLFAGAVAVKLAESETEMDLSDDATRMAIDLYRTRVESDADLLDAIRDSHGGRNLTRLGFDADIARAATCDLFNLVPEWDQESNRVTSAACRFAAQ
ncbi:MAG: 2-phosphosulfolactate phosphatase [Planctomycetaceae bacterium]